MYDHFCELKPDRQRARDTVVVVPSLWEIGYGREAHKSIS